MRPPGKWFGRRPPVVNVQNYTAPAPPSYADVSSPRFARDILEATERLLLWFGLDVEQIGYFRVVAEVRASSRGQGFFFIDLGTPDVIFRDVKGRSARFLALARPFRAVERISFYSTHIVDFSGLSLCQDRAAAREQHLAPGDSITVTATAHLGSEATC